MSHNNAHAACRHINDCLINDFYLETVLPLFPFINGKHPTYVHKTRYEKYEQHTKMK